MSLDFKQYQSATATTAVYPKSKALEYTTLGLIGEAGEIANKVKKVVRGDRDPVEQLLSIADELGDVLWYVSELATTLGFDLDVIAERNLAKLNKRKEAGTIKGSGDGR